MLFQNAFKKHFSWSRFLLKSEFLDCRPLTLEKKRQLSKGFLFFSIWVFNHDHLRIKGLQGKGEGISFTPHCHFHPLHRHLDISRAITAESSPLHIASSRTRTGNLWFPSVSFYKRELHYLCFSGCFPKFCCSYFKAPS